MGQLSSLHGLAIGIESFGGGLVRVFELWGFQLLWQKMRMLCAQSWSLCIKVWPSMQ